MEEFDVFREKGRVRRIRGRGGIVDRATNLGRNVAVRNQQIIRAEGSVFRLDGRREDRVLDVSGDQDVRQGTAILSGRGRGRGCLVLEDCGEVLLAAPSAMISSSRADMS